MTQIAPVAAQITGFTVTHTNTNQNGPIPKSLQTMNSVSHKDWTHLRKHKDLMVISMTGSDLNLPIGTWTQCQGKVKFMEVCAGKRRELYGTFSQLVLNRSMAGKKEGVSVSEVACERVIGRLEVSL